MITGNYEKFCTNYELCDGYEKAINSSKKYFLHHIQGEYISKEELLEKDLYYDCHHSVLKWVTKSEHQKIHHKGRVCSDETRKKMSDAKKGMKSPLKGKVLSDEHRKKISESKKGRTPWNKGRVMSPEARKKNSESQKGKVLSDEHRKKISESKKGRTPWNKGKTCKLVDGKRIYSDSKK